MSQTEHKTGQYRLRTSYLISVVSISMVLIMLGLQGWLILNARAISSKSDTFVLTVYFRDTTSISSILDIKKQFENLPGVKSVSYTDRETAARQFQEELGEDFVEFLGYNPMPASLGVIFKPEQADETFFLDFERKWTKHPDVEKVDYPRNLLLSMASNMKRLGWILLAAGALMALIAITLINNTIRLTIFARRFLIKTMLLVGATQKFIRRPFILSGIAQGFAGGILSCLMLAILLWFGEQQIPGLRELRNLQDLALLGAGLILSGVLLSLICTFFAVRKYLNIKTDQLY